MYVSFQRGRHSLVHVSIVDVTELQNAVELRYANAWNTVKLQKRIRMIT